MVLVLAGCIGPNTRWSSPTSGAGASSTPKAAAATTVSWRSCPEVAKAALGRTPPNVTYDCGTVKVPQDWKNPTNGKQYGIALLRARATHQTGRIGSLLVDPGGPGGSGVDLAAYLSVGLPTAVTDRFDIVGFDPRGVGRSEPVKCFSDGELDASFGAEPDPVSQADFDKAVALARTMAQSCGTKYGDSLRLFSTEQAAHDMDAIRSGLGEQKLTYLGYSYGTLLGATYAQLYPAHVRALVLDGAVDPTLNSVAAAESQAKGFERAFDNFAAWCANNAGKCPIAPDARAAVTSAMDAARHSPVRGPDGRSATAGWIQTAVISSLYSQEQWSQLATAIDNLRKGNASGVFRLADSYAERDSHGHYSNLFDANMVVNCTDDPNTPSVDKLRALQADWRKKYPMFGASTALNLVCAQWPGKRDAYPAGAAKGAPPVVVVGTTGDPATPYEQTAKLADMLGVGTVLTWQGEGHTAYPQTRCITDAVNKYLIDLTVPTKGTTCPAQ
ncbi:alpha/beta hydrolase [Planosporangium thailandense]|uniref:Alpha/beta hydrolase n=1 Tax=Planosporangium thailandense TaxID=765197 RepID=A0ABX0XT01_9ACTN|nr:alpha/beta hydrolase [Planosporangium thailandense]NJC68409.1 alpha/beta hydrolase [Planosporangium thailandense]